MLLCLLHVAIGNCTLPMLKSVWIVLLCVGEIYFITHPIFNFVFSLLHAWVSIVSINLCNPCDQGRVDIIIENMYFHVGNKLIKFISSLFCIHLYMFATRAKSTNKCGIWTCMFSLNCLLAWYIKPVDRGRVRHGKTEVSLTNSASCSMHHALRERCRILYGAH
jgi:hypothetical protein